MASLAHFSAGQVEPAAQGSQQPCNTTPEAPQQGGSSSSREGRGSRAAQERSSRARQECSSRTEQERSPRRCCGVEAAFQRSRIRTWAAVDSFASCALLVICARLVWGVWHSGSYHWARPMLGMVAAALPGLLSRLCPGWYCSGTHRAAVVVITQLVMSLLTYPPEQLSAGLSLEGASSLGLGLKFLVLGRSLPQLLSPFMSGLPLGAMALVQTITAAAAAISNSTQLCSLPMFASPPAQHMFEAAAAFLDSLPAVSPVSLPPPPPNAPPGSDAPCGLLSLWLICTAGYLLPLGLCWLLGARERRAFCQKHCRDRACKACASSKGTDLAYAGGMLGLLGADLAVILWRVLRLWA